MQSPYRKGWVVTVDKNGKQMNDGHWFYIRQPDYYSSNGLKWIGIYVEKLLRSKAIFSSLIISSIDGRNTVSLWQEKGDITLGLSINWRKEPKREQQIREIFAKISIPPSKDYLAGNGTIADATHVLDYSMPRDASFISDLCSRLFLEVFGLSKRDGLNITYQFRRPPNKSLRRMAYSPQ